MSWVPANPSESFRKLNPHLYGKTLQPVHSKGRVRQNKKPLLNKLETEWFNHLSRLDGTRVFAQALRFMLGNGIWYKPDFIVISPISTVIAYEVKGEHAFRGGFENLKVAANIYRWITWKLVWKDNGQWKEQVILAAQP